MVTDIIYEIRKTARAVARAGKREQGGNRLAADIGISIVQYVTAKMKKLIHQRKLKK
jgi:hypothetical protein